ncbi:ABC transporter permease subunit [Auraticoccus sp. F435]|uniref:ABC transporter permease subunit n=1 Tax=Auraticoccus cholistanensis TaxID=2656650 RepID=A0A6A9UQW2_9ACTN|nr:ABC transporter permease [Auraticoccus cholistanensis]MVA75296.1 ABC transporter permease subunit [Auraticoccus cholistanensis]
MDLDWIARNLADGQDIVGLLGLHLVLALTPVVAALVISLPLGYAVSRTRAVAGPLLALFGVVYSVPSLALFVALPLVLGTRILDPLNIVVALTIYTVALLVRSVVDGFRGVPAQTRQAAQAMGMGPLRRVLTVELPLAMPVVFAGLRVVTVSNIALVSVGAVIGLGALGELFDLGLRQGFYTPIVVGIVLIVALALLFDGLILLVQRLCLPWSRGAAA